MVRRLPRFLMVFLLCLAPIAAWAERVADLPMPTRYVNDFAGVLSPGITEEMEATCKALHDQAHADVAVVTIKQLEDGQTVSDFAVKLEDKWKLGQGGTGENSSRSAIYILVLNPHKLWIETGYGLEGILPDAKVGRILDTAVPAAQQGDYDGAMTTGLNGLAQVISADAGVTLTPVAPHQYHRQVVPQQQHSSAGQIVIVVLFLIVFVILVRTGNLGWALVLLANISGGGGGGGGGDDDRGGGFGGSGGGSTGGGGAGRDF